MKSSFRALKAGLVGAVALSLGASMALLGPTASPARAAEPSAPAIIYDQAPVTADPLPTVQMDGVAWTQVISGNTVFVGGQFTNARPAGAAAGTNLTPRTNLLAYNLSTGTLITGWAPTSNSPIRGLNVSADGSTVYVAGQFTQINGVTRYRVAALNSTTGALTSWAPEVNGRVNSIVLKDGVVFIAGEFSAVNGISRPRVAALSASTGAVLPFMADLAGGYGARSVVVSPDGSKVVVGGDFTSANGSTNPGRGLAALDSSTGASLPWLGNSVVRNADTKAGIYNMSSDGDSVYATGWDYGGGSEDGFEGSVRMSWTDGSIVWLEDCHGDSYDVASNDTTKTVYVVSHSHYCGNIGGFPQTNPWGFHHSLAFSKDPTGNLITPDIYGYKSYTGMQAPRPLVWYPNWVVGTFTGQSQAGWTIKASGDYVVVGGEFLGVAGANQQGLVRFTTRAKAPNKMGPQTKGGAYKLTTSSFRAGEARLTWAANNDPDDPQLTYQVFRQDLGLTTPLATFTQKSTFWMLPVMQYTDSNLVAGQTYNYTIKVTDPAGNSTRTDWTPVTVTSTTQATPYSDSVLNSLPTDYWPLGESSGTLGYDWAGGYDQTVTGATRNVAGQQLNATSQATQFGGTSSSFASTSGAVNGPQTFTIEAWFKTTSTSGGKIIGFGSSSSGLSGSYDRHVYLSNQGRVTFGVYPGGVQSISSSTGYNDGQWHQVVASLAGDGQKLWLDGRLIGTNASVTSAQAYSGYWRIGGDNISGWPNTGSSNYLSGSIADVAVYDRALTRTEIDNHWVASGRTSTIQPAPSDSYGAMVYNLNPSLYWRLNDQGGTTAADSGINGYTGTYSNGVTQRQPGALVGVSNQSALFNGKNGTVVAKTLVSGPTTFALETWFKSTSTTGGKIIGFGNAPSGSTSTNYDRHIYMDANGFVQFGVWNGSAATIGSTRALNDGVWHHVVGQISASGMQFYVDGVLQGTNPNTASQDYQGYWRLGGDTSWAGDTYFDGTIDEAAVYPAPLTDAQVQEHYFLGSSGTPNNAPVAQFTTVTSDLTATFDGSTSSDSDGTIASYSWNFGDGTSGTGVTPTHTYAAAGTYQVSLTVTDDRGATATATAPVVVRAPNQLPVANFTVVADFLNLSFDGSSSTDSDGTIQSYSWAFGDGTVGTGATAQHTYAAAGQYQVSLTVTDDRGGSSVKTTTVTVAAPPNQAPNARFTATTDGKTMSVDGTASNDPDGTVASYAWDFGDGTTGTGAKTSHTYAAAGTYTVALTVTDNQGGTGTTSQAVVVSAFRVIASDSFGRSVTGGWGTADVGGDWVTSGGAAAFTVDGTGHILLQPSWSRQANLPGVSSTSTRSTVSFSSDHAYDGGVQAVTLIGRQAGSSVYSARARIESGGIRLYLLRDETSLTGSYVIPNYTYQAGDVLNLSVEVTGTSPTTIKGKVWVNGTPEPTAFNLTASDSTASMQVAGAVGVKAQSAAATNGNRVITVTSYSVVDPSSATVNQPPTAAFTSTTDALKATLDGSTSTDPDGNATIASYAWDFGDTTTGTGITTSHTYTTAGTYQVKLTVTDNAGASNSITKAVTVTAPAVNQPPTAAFTSTTDALKATLDGSTSTDPDGNATIASYAWDFGDTTTGTGITTSHTYTTAGTYQVKLTVTDNAGATDSITKAVTVTAPAVTTLASDAFGRTVTGGWGSADVGGPWTLSGGSAAFSVSSGTGVITLAPSQNRVALVNSVSTTATLSQVDLVADPSTTGGANPHVTVIGRQVGSSYYGGRVRFEATGALRLYALRDETALGSSYLLPNVTYQAGDVVHVKVEVSGTNPTTVKVKAWLNAGTEPTAWQITSTDSTSTMQVAGSVGVKATVGSTSTNPSTRFIFDNYKVTAI
ncbi:PKD domain-containing protein [Aestuariimicrobium sp. T2.26MG-19.2B]|uniref:PKD domain-containing protein n=2 Tax=Aestuariimicrobium TaxID=396388 RepID=UPI00254071C6|nr:PKD domain-containing protein [Aestuariimicrobium sp. T2.26MG-19.2B]